MMAVAAPRPPRRKRRLLLLGIAIVALVLPLAAFEVACRTVLFAPALEPASQQPPAGFAFAEAGMLEPCFEHGLRYRGRPHAAVTIDGIEYRHDALGLRAHRDAEPGESGESGDPATILVLGDSNAYGWRCAAPATFAGRVATLLGEPGRDVTVANAALPGYNTGDALARYRSLREHLKPRLVILAWFVNDLERFGNRVDSRGFLYFDPLPLPDRVKAAAFSSYAYRWIAARRTARLVASHALELRDERNFEFSFGRIAELRAEVERDGRRFLLLDVPLLEPDAGSQRITTNGYGARKSSDRLAAFAQSSGIDLLPLLPAIDGQPVALLWGSIEQNDHHPNARAHELFATAIAAHVRARALLE